MLRRLRAGDENLDLAWSGGAETRGRWRHPIAARGGRGHARARLRQTAAEALSFEATLADQEDKLHACVSANICDASQRTPVQEDARPPVQEGNLRD